VLEGARAKGLSAITTPDPETAQATLHLLTPDVVLTDRFTSDAAGMRLIRHIRAHYPFCSIILMAEEGNEAGVLEALRAGAVDYLRKPLIPEELAESLDRAIHAIPTTVDDVPALELLDYRLTIDTDVAWVEATVSWLMQTTAKMLPESQRLHVRAALIELIVNAIEHGSLEICSRDKREALARDQYEALVEARRQDPRFTGRKVVACASYDKGAGKIRYSVSDEGKGFQWRSLLDRSNEACRSQEANGRGLFLVRAFFPDLTYNEAGTEASFTVAVR
jgi:DNA-binding response OmpR family regulator